MALTPLPADARLDDDQPALSPLPDHVALDQPDGSPATIDDSVRASAGPMRVLDRVNEMLSAPQTALYNAIQDPQSTFNANYIPGGKYAQAGMRYAADRITHPVQAATEIYNGVTGRSGATINDLVTGAVPKGLPSFNDEMKNVSGEMRAYSAEHPVMSGVMSTAGLLTNPVVNRLTGAAGALVPQVAKTATPALQTLAKYTRLGAQGGAVGIFTGATNATGADGGVPTIDDVVHDAEWGGGIGTATGIAAPVVAKVAGKVIGKVADMVRTKAPTMTQEQIKAASRAAYKASEDAGVIVTPESFGDFATALPTELKGYHPAVTDGAARIVKMLQGEAGNGPLTLERLDGLRSVASGASVNPSNPNEGRLAAMIVDKIDDFIDGLTPDKLIGGNAGQAAPALKQARSLWKTQAKLKTISDIVDTGENLNDTNWVKGRFRAIVKNPRMFSRYTQEEQKLISDVARTGSIGKIVRMLPLRGIQMTTQYAEPVMQQGKIDALQDMIARSANPTPAPPKLFNPDFSNNALNAYSNRSGNLLNSFAGP